MMWFIIIQLLLLLSFLTVNSIPLSLANVLAKGLAITRPTIGGTEIGVDIVGVVIVGVVIVGVTTGFGCGEGLLVGGEDCVAATGGT